MLIPTLVLASLLFLLGVFVGARVSGTKAFFLLIISLLISAPGLAFSAYYLKIFNEPIWLYHWRSIPFSEMSASGVGFLMGVLQKKFVGKIKLSRLGKVFLFPVLLLMVVSAPYLKSIEPQSNTRRLRRSLRSCIFLQSLEFVWSRTLHRHFKARRRKLYHWRSIDRQIENEFRRA